MSDDARMDQTDRRQDKIADRVSALEAQSAVLAALANHATEERQALREVIAKIGTQIEEVGGALSEWKLSQRGFAAGVVAVLAILGAILITGWDWITQHVK